MTRFISREKLGKKARKELDSVKRRTWCFSPVSRTVESKKKYDRNKARRDLRRALPNVLVC